MKKTQVSLLLVTILLGFGLLLTVRLPADNPFWVSLQNSGHAPIFAILFIAFFFLATAFSPNIKKSKAALLAIVGALVIAGLSEFLQMFLAGRAATLSDFLTDLVGIGAGLLITLGLVFRKKVLLAGVCLLAGLAIVAGAFYEPVTWAMAFKARDTNAPTLLDFESTLEAKFLFANDSAIERRPAPNGWTEKSSDNMVGAITFQKGRWPVVKFQRVYPNWQGFDAVAFEMYNAEDERIRMTFRIDDVHHNYTTEDRLNHTFWLQPGHNSIRVSLDEVRNAPATRETDMANIKDIMWFASKVKRPLRVYLDNVRLE